MTTEKHFTLVFEGDLRSFAGNPLRTETVFGTPIGSSVSDAFAENEELREKLDKAEDALRRIADWAEAYPLKEFPEPDWTKVEALLMSGGVTLASVSASNMRHVVEGVGRIARDALAQGAPDGEG